MNGELSDPLGSYFRRQLFELFRKPNGIIVIFFQPPERFGQTRELARCMFADLGHFWRWRNAFPRTHHWHDQEIAFM
jgi:hypothetical protein